MNKQQKDFCKYKAQGLSNEKSAIKAGYSESYAKTHSHKLLEKYEIKKEIERLSKKVEQIIEEEFNLSTADIIKDIVEIKNRCMQKTPVMIYDKVEKEYTQKEDIYGQGIWEFDSQSALRACDMLGKYKGIYLKDNEQKRIELPKIEITGVNKNDSCS